jgi:hypothetical protein
MFARSDGPTALRPELVWALAFSAEPVVIDTSSGRSRCEAGIAAIWTGSKGEVVVVIRQIEPAAVARYRFTEPLLSEEAIHEAVETALGFVSSLGFSPDTADFRTLPEASRRARLERWDGMRKVRSKRHASRRARKPEPPEVRADEPEPDPTAEVLPVPTGVGPDDLPAGVELWEGVEIPEAVELPEPEGAPDALATAPLEAAEADPVAAAADVEAPEAASPAAEPPKSVLGRIPLVRREGASRAVDALGRLLSFF